jgi:hypothetical protein
MPAVPFGFFHYKTCAIADFEELLICQYISWIPKLMETRPSPENVLQKIESFPVDIDALV